jgi:hypothetical protein
MSRPCHIAHARYRGDNESHRTSKRGRTPHPKGNDDDNIASPLMGPTVGNMTEPGTNRRAPGKEHRAVKPVLEWGGHVASRSGLRLAPSRKAITSRQTTA